MLKDKSRSVADVAKHYMLVEGQKLQKTLQTWTQSI